MGLKSGGLARRLVKLRAMTAREITSRVGYAATLMLERRKHRRGTLVEPDGLRRSLPPAPRHQSWSRSLLDSRRANRHRFFPSTTQAVTMRALFEARYPQELADCLRMAERGQQQRFAFFGLDFSFPGEIEWQRDPVTGAHWPPVFHADVPVHGGNVGFGDVKHVWELSRQQYLIDLSRAHFLRGDGAHLEAIRRLVRSWIHGNPYATGVNWACALEPAFRTWSWLWTYHMVIESLDDEFHLEWLDAFQLHGRFLHAHMEHYSSPFNHLIGEASALYALGTCFPEFAAAGAWRQQARDVLEGRLAEQFYADGGSREQSAFYHHATLGFYLLSALLGRINSDDFSPAVWGAIERGLEFSMRLSTPDGRTPEIGGADDGKPIRFEHLPFWDFRPYLAVGAASFRRGDFKAAAGRFHEDALWLLGPDGLADFEAIPPPGKMPTTAVLDASGYYVARSDWSAAADYVCFDAGEQAAGMRADGVPNSMHGHADCLSIVVALQGRRVLADSGLYAYNCGGAWEAHFRETAAHSTAKIDGRDQARHIGKMAWSHSYRARLEGAHDAQGRQWAIGSHDGYARGPTGIVHRRSVWLRPGHYLLVWDEFTGTGEHSIELRYQFAPGTLQLALPDRAFFSDFVEMAWASNLEWSADVKTGGEAPDEGWVCPSLGVRIAAPRLRLTARTTAARTVIGAVFAGRREPQPLRIGVVEMPGLDGALIRIGCGGTADWVTLGYGRTPLESRGYPAVCTVSPDGQVLETSSILDVPVSVDPALMDLERRWPPDPPQP